MSLVEGLRGVSSGCVTMEVEIRKKVNEEKSLVLGKVFKSKFLFTFLKLYIICVVFKTSYLFDETFLS